MEIEIKDLCFGYGKNDLFTNLNLSGTTGNIYGLMGKNGAGKTSLLKILAGLLHPRQGQCLIGGDVPSKRNPSFLENIFFLPEEFSLPKLMPDKFVRIYAPFYPRFDHDLLINILEEFEIDRKTNLRALSFGQKKKFLLAFLISARPKLMLMDEPTNGLDIPAKSQFRKILAKNLIYDQTVIISTHQARDLENLIDPVIILDQGKIIFNQPISEVARKLSLKYLIQYPENEDIIYAQESITGYAVVTRNLNDDDDSHLELEILFNTVVNNPEGIQRIFEKGGK